MCCQVSVHYAALRTEALTKMVETGSAPYAIKKRALKQLTKDEKVMKEKQEKYQLKKTVMKTDHSMSNA